MAAKKHNRSEMYRMPRVAFAIEREDVRELVPVRVVQEADGPLKSWLMKKIITAECMSCHEWHVPESVRIYKAAFMCSQCMRLIMPVSPGFCTGARA
jgi:hypothetical protein